MVDMQMPEMNGLEATWQIRQLPGREHTPIIASTANTFDDDRMHCYAVGMNDFLAKPFDMSVLMETLLTWLKKREK
jgi:two-component system sensor histidine kinase/response regulator